MRLDDQFSVLSNHHRRQLLLALADNDPPVSEDVVETDGGNRDQAIEMQHVHLPLLADHEVIKWNEKIGEVAKGPQFDAIEPLLTAITTVNRAESGGERPE